MSVPTKSILPEKIKDKSYLLYKIQQKHHEFNDVAKCAILIGGGCSHPTLPLGGGLIEYCQKFCFIRDNFPIPAANLEKDFLKNIYNSTLDDFIKNNSTKDKFNEYVSNKEKLLLNKILERKQQELDRISEFVNNPGWNDFESEILNDAKYGYWMDEYNNSPRERQRLIEAMVEGKNPGGAYIILAMLIEKGFFKNILTTNFDDFINDTLLNYTSTRPKFYADDELSQYISIHSGKPNIIKLHGDYRYANIKNTSEETFHLSKSMGSKLTELLQNLDLIVIGYRGADYSIMSVLQNGKGANCELLWCDLDENKVHWRVANLINNTPNSWFIKIKGFDDLIKDFYLDFVKTPPDLITKAKQRQDEITGYIKEYNIDLQEKAESEEEKADLKKQEAIWELITKAIKEKDEIKKIEIYNKVIELDDTVGVAYNNRGLAYSHLKKYNKAIEDFNRALKLDDSNSTGYYNRGSVYNFLQDYDNALKDLTKAIELDVNYAGAYNNRGLVYSKLKDNYKALKDYSKAIELEPTNAIGYCNRGIAYSDLNQHSKAIIDLTKAIELNVNYIEAYNNRGLVYRDLKEYDKAIDDCNKALSLKKNSISYYYRGTIYESIEKYDKAIEDFTKSIELDENYAIAYNSRGYIFSILNEYELAIIDFTKAIELEKYKSVAYYNRGCIYVNLKKYNEAIQDFTKTIEIDKGDIDAYKMRAQVYRILGEIENAKRDEKIAKKFSNKI